MEFSVIIPTYNRAPVLERTLRALAAQRSPDQGPPSFEVVVVDDGSTDDTPQVLERRGREFPVPFRTYRQENRKQGAARNLGARECRGNRLLFLGDDTVPHPHLLYRHALAHDPGERRRVVIGYTPWAPELRPTRFMEYIGEWGWQFGFSLIQDPQDLPFNFFYTSNLSISRDFFWEAGGFDEDFREYGWEDIELGWRLQQRGMKLVYEKKAVAWHFHPTSLRSFIRRQLRVGFSAWQFYQKHPEMAEFLNVLRVPSYTWREKAQMWLLTQLCCWTETLQWPDLSAYYPDLMSYYYHLGILRARREEGE